MDVSRLLARDSVILEDGADGKRQSHQYPTRHAITSYNGSMTGQAIHTPSDSPAKSTAFVHAGPRPSPKDKQQKHVTFELLLPLSQNRARLPMRIMISSHDTTESIITTVRNFYGLYDGPGVSFQDREGNILIAAYDNFENDMTIHVRVTPEEVSVAAAVAAANTAAAAAAAAVSTSAGDRFTRNSASPRKPKLGAAFEMRPPSYPFKADSGLIRGRSPSPSSRSPGGRTRLGKQKIWEDNGGADANDGYSSSDGGNGSVSSSRRSRAEAHASAEISVDNIVEGGRRKRAKFESCELPLFVPPQVPMTTSLSSVSPQRRLNGDYAASPLPLSNQRTFSYTQPLPSPHSYGRADVHHAQSAPGSAVWGQGFPYNGNQVLTRGPITYQPPRQSTGGILPTPEPTVGSVISDEDVALQLMRLGDASNFSHGRTSTSTLDDALSGKAEAASSDEGSNEEKEPRLPDIGRHSRESHDAEPRRKKLRTVHAHLPSVSGHSSSDNYDERGDDSFKGDSDDIVPEQGHALNGQRPSNRPKSLNIAKPRGSISSFNDSIKSGKIRAPGQVKPKVKSGSSTKVPISPASLPSQSRKTSMASNTTFPPHVGLDEEDLSSKPRCQRCRKSKKGCDRQRPCGRCKDAGIGADGCVSEDEGNGRRGRYGRHMGVTIKKDDDDEVDDDAISLPSSHVHGHFLAPILPSDKSKKRKRLSP